MLQPISEHSQREGFHPRDSFFACLAISHHPGKLRHFCQPATVFFTFDFDLQVHGSTIRVVRGNCRTERSQAAKSENRTPKHEGNPKTEGRKRRIVFDSAPSNFGFRPSFELRYSDFGLLLSCRERGRTYNAPMLDIKLIRERPDFVRQRLAARGAGDEARIDELLKLDEQRRKLLGEVEALKAQRKRVSKEIGALMGQKKVEEAEAKKKETGDLGDRITVLDKQAE